MLDPHEALHKELSDRYELAEVLGEGSMGTVYLARDRKHDRWVAIKTIHPERTNAEVRQRFQREIGITAQLQHPHILPLLDSGAAGETLYYVMPYVEGESLQSRLERDGRLSIEEAIPIAHDVAEALQHAHGRGVVHRDIKPGNIMLAGGNAVVTDFGIARAIAEAEGVRLTQTGLAIGSPAYMSPEQSTGERAADGRSDIYSLGCVLYEMLAGEPPFTGSTPLELIARSIREEAPPLRSKAQAVPPEVEGAVHKALAKAPEDRFQTAEAFAQALTGGREAAAAQALTAVLSGQQAGAHSFWSELRRRKVYNTAVLYALGAWILVQVAETTFPYLGLSDWAITIVIVSAIVGFPGALALAWAFDLTRKGIRRTGPVDVRAVAVAKASRRSWWRTGAAVALAVTAVLAVGSILPRVGAPERGLDPAVARQSIAVLPFTNLSADPKNEYFSDGITDDILTQLARIGDLKVISRTSIMKYKNRAGRSLPEIAGELGVGTVLEGAVQRAGDRVRVNVQLIDASTDRHLWAQTYDEELTAANIFAIQSDIARKIAAALQATLAPDVEERIESRPTESLEAYDLYNRGRYISNRSGTREDLESAADLYRQAIAADPAYAPAHVGLASTYVFKWFQGFLAAEEALPQARAAVERALELDETLAEAHAALGTVLTAELRFEEAEREFQRALELNPGSAAVHLQYSQLLLGLARYEDSVRETRRAVELDPLSMANRVSLAATLMYARDYEASIVELLRILELEPENSHAYYLLGASYTLNGQHKEGLAAIRRSIELDPEDVFGPPLLAWVSARAGQRDEALEALEQIEEQGPMLKEIAMVYGELGDLDQAFEFLDRAYAEDPGSLVYLRADPTADSLKDDPRFAELVRKLGLE
jgi:serine/threonine-protein kinase